VLLHIYYANFVTFSVILIFFPKTVPEWNNLEINFSCTAQLAFVTGCYKTLRKGPPTLQISWPNPTTVLYFCAGRHNVIVTYTAGVENSIVDQSLNPLQP